MIRHGIGTVTVDKELIVVKVNEGYSDYDLLAKGQSFLDHVRPEDKHLVQEMAEHISDNEPYSLCFRLRDKKEEYNWAIALCNKKETADGDNIQIALQDISDIAEMATESSIDFGTGLLDKKSIVEYAVDKCEHHAGVFNLCILDIDNFKNINDNKGHSFGDEVLKDVSTIIRNIIGSHGKAGRIGGDEIMIIIDDAADNSALRGYLKPIRESVENLHRDKNGFPMITVSIGSARYPTDVSEYDTLFDLADRMLYRAKNRGKNRYVMYNPDIHGQIVDGMYKEENKTIQDATPVDKIKLVLEAIDGFLGCKELDVADQLTKIIATYDLDYVYVFYGNVSKSYSGYKRLESTEVAENKGVKRIVEVTADISFVRDDDFDALFNANGVFVVDSPEAQLSASMRADRYFTSNDIKHAFIYKMKGVENGGYVFFYNTNELSRKFPQPDITDFTYLSKMIEVALKTR